MIIKKFGIFESNAEYQISDDDLLTISKNCKYLKIFDPIFKSIIKKIFPDENILNYFEDLEDDGVLVEINRVSFLDLKETPINGHINEISYDNIGYFSMKSVIKFTYKNISIADHGSGPFPNRIRVNRESISKEIRRIDMLKKNFNLINRFLELEDISNFEIFYTSTSSSYIGIPTLDTPDSSSNIILNLEFKVENVYSEEIESSYLKFISDRYSGSINHVILEITKYLSKKNVPKTKISSLIKSIEIDCDNRFILINIPTILNTHPIGQIDIITFESSMDKEPIDEYCINNKYHISNPS